MGIINILDTMTANMIAAGEVVEKPASAVKEMIENSIDAGAKHIICEIRGGGNSYIRITDDGKGMSGDDLPKAILPHATSKILTADDLDGVLTLGFRGEALAAISSVSRLEILSKQRHDDIGHKLLCDENGVEISEEGAPDGTVITVRDLFYNVPARRKFMRKDSTEASAIASVVTKSALAHPEVSFKLISEGNTKFITPGDGDLYSSIYATLGKEFASALTVVTGVHGEITVGGYISRPGESRGSRSGQYFFVNGRPIQSTQIMAALEQAFRSYMPSKRFPAAVLKLEVPPKFVDVNVHPTKTEIKFADDRKIFEAVYSAVLSALRCEDNETSFLSNSAVNELDIPNANLTQPQKEKKLDWCDFKPYSSKADVSHEKSTPSIEVKEAFAKINADKAEKSFVNTESCESKKAFCDDQLYKSEKSYILLRDPNVPLTKSFEERVSEAEKANTLKCISENKSSIHIKDEATTNSDSDINFSAESQASLSTQQDCRKSNTVDNASKNPPISLDIPFEPILLQNIPAKVKPAFKVIGEIFGGYIVTETETALLLIDKHAAHERIIYEELSEKRGSAQSQMLLSPYAIRLGFEATEILLDNKDFLLSYGFEIDSFGNDSIAVRAIPSTLGQVSGIESLLDEFASHLSNGDRLSFEKRCDRALYTLACKAAIKLGLPTSNEDLSILVEKLLGDPKLRLCPHGRPIVKEITKREIEKFFDR